MDVYYFLAGFKDGAVAITGDESKLSLCNGYVSSSLDTWALNWMPYFEDTATKLNADNWNVTLDEIADNTGKLFRWPFQTLFSCYWATNDLIYRYDNLRVPLLRQPETDLGDGTYQKVGFWENVLFNFAFNAGYQMRDLIWLFLVQSTEGDTTDSPTGSLIAFWYRLGYVSGDFYMRFFFRNTIDAPEKLKVES